MTAAGSLDEEDIELLVEAMAAYTPPEGYDAQWTPEMEAALAPEIETAWDLFA